jgi:hypothetical protein
LLSHLIDEATRDFSTGMGRLENLIPGYMSSQGGPMIDEHYIPMRGAVTLVQTRINRLPCGETVDGRYDEARAVIWARIRNKDWVGSNVADAIHRAWDLYRDADWVQASEGPIIHGLGRPEHVVMDMRLPLNDDRLIDYSETDSLHFEQGETRVRATYKPTPDWDYDPAIEIEISAPPPAKQVISAWFDDVAIETYGWTSRLRGGTSGQGVETAIRTWTAALLIAAGRKQYQAFGDFEALTGNEFPSPGVYYDNIKDLLHRVPEARPFLAVRGNLRTAPDCL